MSAQAVPILGSEMHLLDSMHTGRKYRITVSLPLGYAKPANEGWPFNRTPEKWPVVYALDGNWYFGMVTEIIRPMAWCGSTTDAIVVGTGYEEGNDPISAFRQSFTRRNADLTPVRDEAEEIAMERQHKRPAPTGDAANFLQFIQNELIPLIESQYRTDPNRRILAGHSYGGLFALFILFQAPGLFEAMVAGSPTLIYGDRYIFALEEAFAKQQTKLPVKLYLFVAELEEAIDDTTVSDTLRLVATLQSRKYEGLTVVKHIFADQNHCEVAAPGIQWGLKSVLKK